MALFGNPMDSPWTSNRKLSLFLYLIFLAASVWACGESLARTLEASKLLCYILAFAALATASFCLGLVKKSRSRGYVSSRGIKFLFGAVGFIILWFAILAANTHNIYYVMTIGEQRQKELRNVKTQLELVKDKSAASFNAAKTKFSNTIEGEIANLKNEIQNPNNPGHGSMTDTIINRIEGLLGQEVDLLTNPPTDMVGRRRYAGLMADKIREMTKTKLTAIDEKITQLNTFLQKQEYQDALSALDDLINNSDIKPERETTRGLRNSHTLYSKCQQYIDQLFSEPFIQKYSELSIERIPDVPVSIQMEDIAYSWGEFLNKGSNVDRARFWWSIFIALILDLACFLFWYFGVLPEEE